MTEPTLEQVQELFNNLTDDFLTNRQAFSVIYFFQKYGVIPDHYEMCAWCGKLFDSWCDGGLVNPEREDFWYAEWNIPLSATEKYANARICDPECEYSLLMQERES